MTTFAVTDVAGLPLLLPSAGAPVLYRVWSRSGRSFVVAGSVSAHVVAGRRTERLS